MGLSKHFILAIALCAFALGCSGSQQASETGNGDDQIVGDSQADSVGSIPEDLLASEEKSQSADAGDSNAAEAADPFADLKESDKKEESASRDSMSLIEGGNETASAAGSGSGSMETYTVKSGDTLMKIAFSIYGDIDRWKDLQDWNSAKLKKANALAKGMKLQYETPMTPFTAEEHAHSYLIKKGDTLANIADEVYGKKMKYKKLQNYNKNLIRNPNRIFAGFTIFYDITAQEIADADARRKERMAQGSGGGGGYGSTSTQTEAAVPSAITPPAESLVPPAPEPIAVAPAAPAVPAPASTSDPMAPPPPPAN